MNEQTIKDINRAFKALEERDELLDKIRAEIEKLEYVSIRYDKYIEQYEVLKIIDKYKAESEGE